MHLPMLATTHAERKLSSWREDKGSFRAEKAHSEVGLAVMLGRTVACIGISAFRSPRPDYGYKS
jgi:hypothetical protein